MPGIKGRKRGPYKNRQPLAARIEAGSIPEPNSGCWLWDKAVMSNGYGLIMTATGVRTAHRVSYEAFRGPIPEGLELDHKCRVRSCVNPNHLEAVTKLVNVRRGLSGARNRQKTHCKNGHELSEENVLRDRDGGRHCRACSSLRLKQFRSRKREQHV
jgi:hypothetical protein